MHIARALAVVLAFFALAQCSCKASSQAGASNPAPLTTLTTPQGGIIEYGRVDGATSLAAAMGKVLGEVHQACGEKPSVGQVFRVKGTDSAGVFFTIGNHAQGNRQMAGMVIAAHTGAGQFEAGLVSDSADRFGQTVNTLLQQLSSAWHPGGTPSASTTAGGAGSGPTPGSTSSSPVPLHRVSAPDSSVSLSVPNGWAVQPNSGWGAIIVKGPNGEQIGLGMNKGAVDPTNAWQARMAAAHYSVIMPGSLVYAFRGDVTKEFTNLFQAWRRSGGAGPARIEIDAVKPMPTNPGNHCAQVSGEMDPDGKGMQAFIDLMCATDATPDYGIYSVILNHALYPLAVFDKEKDTLNAILQTYVPNAQVISQENAALLAKERAWRPDGGIADEQRRLPLHRQPGARCVERARADGPPGLF